MSNEFDFDTKNGWKHYADAVSQEQMDVLATRYMDFLSHAPAVQSWIFSDRSQHRYR